MKMTLNTGNMIIKTTDKNNNGDRLIENLDEYSQIFDADMIITGLVIAEQAVPDMSVQISKGVAEDKTVDTFLSSQALASLTVPAADGSLDRFDTIEIRRLIDENTPESRQFKDPNTEAISTNVVDTVREYMTEFKLLAGTPGSGIAVVSEPGWIKIGEVLVSAAVSSIVDAKIYNVDAVVEGGTNTNWTNNITDVYRNGSQKELKTDIFTKGVPAHSLTVPYEEFFSFVQDEGMVWASILAANQGNKPSTNQDKWIPAYAPTKGETISSTGAFTTLYRHHHITSDTSGGGNTITLSDGKFDDQKATVICDGIGLTHVKGTGVYDGASSLGTPISDTLKATWKWNANLAKWIADNGITADYLSSSALIVNFSDGRMEESIRFSKNNGTTSAQFWVYPIAFLGAVLSNVVRSDSNTPVIASIANTPSNIQIPVLVQDQGLAAVTTNVTADILIKGKY